MLFGPAGVRAPRHTGVAVRRDNPLAPGALAAWLADLVAGGSRQLIPGRHGEPKGDRRRTYTYPESGAGCARTVWRGFVLCAVGCEWEDLFSERVFVSFEVNSVISQDNKTIFDTIWVLFE